MSTGPHLAETAVAYDGLPISSGGAHALGRIPAREALGAWNEFLDSRTDYSAVDSYFDLPMTPQLDVDPVVALLIAREFPIERARGGSHPTGALGRRDLALRIARAASDQSLGHGARLALVHR